MVLAWTTMERGLAPIARPEDRLVRPLGVLLVGSLWLCAGYLLLYYGALWTFGYERLYEWLGQDLYNRLVPGGGVWVAGAISLRLLVWQVPFALLCVSLWWGTRALLPRLAVRVRCALVGVAATGILAGLHLCTFDGWPMVLAPVLGFETEFAPGYTASAFRDVREGMAYAEVVEQLGEPLHGLTSGVGYGAGYTTGFLVGDEQFCVWSRSPSGSHHSMRAIHFRDGVVFKKVAAFHWD